MITCFKSTIDSDFGGYRQKTKPVFRLFILARVESLSFLYYEPTPYFYLKAM